MLRLALLLTLSPMAAFGIDEPPSPAKLDFKAAMRYALDNSPALQADKERAEVSDLQRRNARTKFLPSLDLSSTHGLLSSKPATPTDPWSSSVQLALTETLYDNHTSIVSYRLAARQRDLADLQVSRTRDKLLLDAALAFYQFSQAKRVAEVREELLTLTRKQFNAVEHQYQQGLRMRRDYLRFKSQFARADIDVRQANIDVERNAAALRALIGVAPAAATTFEPLEPTVVLDELPQSAPPVSGTYEYRLAEIRSSLAEPAVELANRRYWPNVGLTAGASYGNSSYLGSPGRFAQNEALSWNVLLTLSYNIWDWGLRRNEVAIAEKNRIVADHAFRSDKLAAGGEVKALMLDLEQLRTTYVLSRDLVKSEEETFGFLAGDYREGKVQSYDLIANLRDLLGARVGFTQARYALQSGIMRYHYYAGRIHEKLALD